MIARSLRIAPLGTLSVLVVWTGWDVAHVSTPRWDTSLQAFFAISVALLALGETRWGVPLRQIGMLVLGLSYYAAHVVDLGVDVVRALVFLTLLIVQVELRLLMERFAPLYERRMPREARRRISEALLRAAARLGATASLAVLVPIVTADLALAGLVPTTSIVTAVMFAVGLVAVVVLLALLPTLRRPKRA